MKFKANTLFSTGKGGYVYLNDLSVKEQKALLKEHPHLEKFVEYEDDKKGSDVDVKVQPQQKRSSGRSRKSKSE